MAEEFKATETMVPFRNRDLSITMIEIPDWWRGSAQDVCDTVKLVKKGEVTELCKTPGGWPMYMVFYGKRNDLKRTANLSSAQGAGNLKCYADKTGDDYIPTVCLIGAEHGGEFEGTVALNNLIKEIETGEDYKGEKHPDLMAALEGINLIIIPLANMDGRARIPLKTFVGQNFESFRYYSQGTWKDGTLCMHPGCKEVHPLKDACEFIGGYFNNDGVNIVHDNFFFPKAKETESLLKVADEFVPDISLHLHGGGNCRNTFYQFDYMPKIVKDKIASLNRRIKQTLTDLGEGDRYTEREVVGNENNTELKSPPSFNIQSAWTAICGEPAIVYETNQGLFYEEGRPGWKDVYSFEEIYFHHRHLFKETFNFIKEYKPERKED